MAMSIISNGSGWRYYILKCTPTDDFSANYSESCCSRLSEHWNIYCLHGLIDITHVAEHGMATSKISNLWDNVRNMLGLSTSTEATYPAVVNGTENDSTAMILDYVKTTGRISVYVNGERVGYININQ